jgi:hypothetical protein
MGGFLVSPNPEVLSVPHDRVSKAGLDLSVRSVKSVQSVFVFAVAVGFAFS